MAKERIYDSIHIKPTYIFVHWIERLIYVPICFILVWILSLSLYVSIAQYYQNQILFTTALPLSVLTALIPSSLILLLERILKRLTKKWKYTEFRFVQRFARTLVFQIVLYLTLFFVGTALYGQLPSWTGFLVLVLMLIMITAGLLVDFYNLIGGAVLCFETFLVEFDKKADDADFVKLLRGAKKLLNWRNTITWKYLLTLFPLE